MTTKVNPIPEGYHTVTPYMIVNNAAEALEFYKKAFGAVELFRYPDKQGRIGHAEIKIGNSHIMLADEHPEMNIRGAKTFGGSPIMIHLYVEDVDGMFAQAIAAGAKTIRPLQDQFYGDRIAMVEDPFGHTWSIATHKEDVSPEEMKRREESASK